MFDNEEVIAGATGVVDEVSEDYVTALLVLDLLLDIFEHDYYCHGGRGE